MNRHSGGGLAKAFAIFGVGTIVGFGTCGLAFLDAVNNTRRASEILVPLGAIVFGVSVIGLVVTAFVALVRYLSR